MKILVVDDELDLLKELCITLKHQGYETDTAADGETALDKVFDNAYDLIILDIMLSKIDGLAILKRLRDRGIKTPVLMLAAKESVVDSIPRLDYGADDYLPKPFDTAEFMAEVRSLLRRTSELKDTLLTVKHLSLDTKTREVFKNSIRVELTPKEFSILEFLLYNKNRAISRSTLAEHVWGDAFDPFTMSNIIDIHIKNLRRKIEEAERPGIIRNIRGIGFIIEDEKE
jgi:DNA-binding response OmpR family regulator